MSILCVCRACKVGRTVVLIGVLVVVKVMRWPWLLMDSACCSMCRVSWLMRLVGACGSGSLRSLPMLTVTLVKALPLTVSVRP